MKSSKESFGTLLSALLCAAFVFLCDFVLKGWSMLFRIFNLDFCLPSNIDSWMHEGLNSKVFCPKGNILW